MHMLITVVVEAKTPEMASSIAKGLFRPGLQTSSLIPQFDSGKLLTNDDARYRGAVPDIVQEQGAIRADTDDGLKVIEDCWDAQLKGLSRYFQVVKAAFERDSISMADIFNDVRVEDVGVEPWNPLGLSFDGDEPAETTSERILYAMFQLSRDRGSSIHLYDKNGWGIRGPDKYDELLNDIEAAGATESENCYYAVPMDVKY